MRVCITGAAGNLGGLLTRHLLAESDLDLNLLIHHTNVPKGVAAHDRVQTYRGDLGQPETLTACLEGVDCVVHFAGVLFRHDPESFLPTTNTEYFRNLCKVVVAERVRRVILISFPHVEGETTPDAPATGRLDGAPDSVHAQTRLEEEKHLLGEVAGKGVEAVSLRVGMVYGKGVLMIDAARWLAKRRILGVWRKPTWIHLISKDDFLAAAQQSIELASAKGIYHIGDDGHETLQGFLDVACKQWECKRPWRMPDWLILFAARICELQSKLFGTASPLTRDFIRIGMQSYYGDTRRMRSELLPTLKYPTLDEGKSIL